MNNKLFVGRRVSSFERYDDIGPITGVALIIDEENELTAGDDSGYVLEIDCPYGTQAMADNILASVQGQTYRGFRANDAPLDIGAELGDGITVNGVYSMLAYRSLTFGPGHMSEVAAPGESELEHEYPYISSTQREINRKIATTRSLITKTAEEIRLEVENELEGLSSSFTVRLDSISSNVTSLAGDVSSIEQYIDSITLSVSNGSTSSTIKLMAGSAEIASQTIRMSGLVTFTSLSTAGQTQINGANITTGLIDAGRLNLTGAITFNDLSTSVRNDIDDAWSMAYDAQSLAEDVDDVVSGWTYGGTTYIDGEMIMAGTVRAGTLEGGEIVLLDSNERTAGYIGLEGAASYSGTKVTFESGAIEIAASYGDVYIKSGDGTFITVTDRVSFGGDIAPAQSTYYTCGTSTRLWNTVYAASSAIDTSDLRVKKDVVYGLEDYDAFFDKLLPMSFRFIDGTAGRRHMGFGAQDVEAALAECGISTQDFAGFVKEELEDGGYYYGLRYSEFIPILAEQIQKLKKRVKILEAGGN